MKKNNLPSNAPGEPGLYWAMSKGSKHYDLLVLVKGLSPYMEAWIVPCTEGSINFENSRRSQWRACSLELFEIKCFGERANRPGEGL